MGGEPDVQVTYCVRTLIHVNTTYNLRRFFLAVSLRRFFLAVSSYCMVFSQNTQNIANNIKTATHKQKPEMSDESYAPSQSESTLSSQSSSQNQISSQNSDFEIYPFVFTYLDEHKWIDLLRSLNRIDETIIPQIIAQLNQVIASYNPVPTVVLPDTQTLLEWLEEGEEKEGEEEEKGEEEEEEKGEEEEEEEKMTTMIKMMMTMTVTVVDDDKDGHVDEGGHVDGDDEEEEEEEEEEMMIDGGSDQLSTMYNYRYSLHAIPLMSHEAKRSLLAEILQLLLKKKENTAYINGVKKRMEEIEIKEGNNNNMLYGLIALNTKSTKVGMTTQALKELVSRLVICALSS